MRENAKRVSRNIMRNLLKPVQSRMRIDSIQAHCELLYSEPLLELQHVNDAAAMGAIADLAVAVPGLHLEHHALGIDLDDPRNGADRAAARSCCEVRAADARPKSEGGMLLPAKATKCP